MQVSATWWFTTIAVIAGLLALDLLVSGRRGQLSTRQCIRWVAFYCAAALIFGLVITLAFSPDHGGQFIAGWVTEYSLSVDNLFVFMVLMARFNVPEALQLRVLTIGVVLALLLRGALIGVGSVALQRFSWLFYLFGAFLLYTAWSMFRPGDPDGPDDLPGTPDDLDEETPAVVRMLQRVVPTTATWHGTKLLLREDGRLRVTPMLLTMMAIGITDVLFAFDSIPAIFGLTSEPFLVVTANAFALIGLRQLFFVVRGLLDRLAHLSVGLSLVLAFIGVKLILDALHGNTVSFINGGEHVDWAPEIPTVVSLSVVLGILALTALTSMISDRRGSNPEKELESTSRPGAEPTAGPSRNGTREASGAGPRGIAAPLVAARESEPVPPRAE
jgi:tellurite resistance protein TerC